MADAKQIAFQRNWDLLTAKSGIDSATAQFIVAKEFPNPMASLTTSDLATHHIATTEGNGVWQRSYDTIAAVSQLMRSEASGMTARRRRAPERGRQGALL